jgi:SAM-dependent methyltransferase
MSTDDLPFWERPDTVERFAGRDPDHRLQALAPEYRDPARVRVLDLGCAGGRNAVFLAERGFDFVAVDAAEAMVAETRRRVAAVLGEEEARARVRRGRMDRLELPDASFDLVLALGVHHTAGSREEWQRSLAETRRVLAPGGKVLVANQTDGYDPDGTGLTPVPGEPDVYERTSGRSYLVSAEVLDADMARVGLVPLVPTETVRRENDRGGVRVTANALYGLRPEA